MATEHERYLRKARESLASAQADVRARRSNSAANRAYYAAFQAAVAALIQHDIRPTGNWEHEFVANRFSGKLVWRMNIIKL
ncbi:MAG: HEPN domain-containing protein [Chloroflexota bacterium]